MKRPPVRNLWRQSIAENAQEKISMKVPLLWLYLE